MAFFNVSHRIHNYDLLRIACIFNVSNPSFIEVWSCSEIIVDNFYSHTVPVSVGLIGYCYEYEYALRLAV